VQVIHNMALIFLTAPTCKMVAWASYMSTRIDKGVTMPEIGSPADNGNLQLTRLTQLSEEALAAHAGFSLGDVRKYALALHCGELGNAGFESHLRTCDICSNRLALLVSTDPILTAEAEDGFKVSIHKAEQAENLRFKIAVAAAAE
jgi:hypothetical protein